MSAAANSAWDKPPAPPSGERRPSFGGEPPRKDKSWQGAGLLIALLASIGLHGVIVVGTVVVNVLEKRNAPPPETVIELVDASQFPRFVPPPPAAAMSGGPTAAVPAPVPEVPPDEDTVPKKQLVELAKPDSAQTAPADAKYLAEHNHRVKEETAARETAMAPKVLAPEFRGTGESNAKDAGKLEGAPDQQGEGIGTDAKTEREIAGKAPTAAQRSPDRPVDSLLTEDPFGIRIRPRAASVDVADAGRIGTGERDVSTMAGGNGTKVAMAGAPNNDYLPNVRPGDRTQLNAKEFKFASFWHRVQRQVEPFWASNVRSASPGQIQKRDYMTRVNLVLGPDGSLVGVEIVKSCGVPAWDRAVVDAFTEAAPFLNPPAALVEADGKIHMGDLGFIVSLTGGQIVHMYGDPRAGKLFPGVGEGYGPGR